MASVGAPFTGALVDASSAGVSYKPARPERERHPATTNIETPLPMALRWEFPIKKPASNRRVEL
jgi:hypothetical protein